MQSDPELKAMGDNVEPLDQEERYYLKGLRLWLVLGCVILVTFLVLLDMSILGTVRPLRQHSGGQSIYTARLSLKSPPNSIHYLTSDGTSGLTT